MIRASMRPSSGEKLLYLCDTGICHSVWMASGLLVGFAIQPEDQVGYLIEYIMMHGTINVKYWPAGHTGSK